MVRNRYSQIDDPSSRHQEILAMLEVALSAHAMFAANLCYL